MFRLTLADCQQPLDGKFTRAKSVANRGVNSTAVSDDVHLSGFSIDTRTLQAGDLYIAIHGEQFDGHDFIRDAEKRGASGVLVHRPVDTQLPCLQVEDTRRALSELAKLWARGHQVPTIAVTGSNGKTTVKEIIAAILQQRGPVLATEGNYNNDIGVPLTLLRLRAEHRHAVVELGANHAGEIAALSELVTPQVAIVNNVGPAHLEGFGSVEAVAAAKAEIYTGLAAEGTAVINADDAFAPVMREAANGKHVCEFGIGAGVDVRGLSGQDFRIELCDETLAPMFRLSGAHNRLNALAATAATHSLGIDRQAILDGLSQVEPVAGRLQSKVGVGGATLIDDSYNANPASVRSAIDVLSAYDGVLYLVLGDMAELGEDAAELHASVGTYARERGIDELWAIGELTKHCTRAFGNGQQFDSLQALIERLRPLLSEHTTVLVKGSRSSRMERVIDALLSGGANDHQPVLEAAS